jgi:hypothetical protein
MARLYAQNRLSMWQDDEFRSLSDGAQNLYNYLLAHPTTTYAGVSDWRPKRLAQVNTSWTAERVEELGRELARGHFLVIDEDYDEVVIRSFLRWEGVLKSPNLARACARAFGRIESPTLQRVVIHELLRLKAENPDFAAWDLDEFPDILTARPPLDGKTIPAPISSANPSPNPSAEGSADPSSNPSGNPSAITFNQYPLPITPEPATSNLSTAAVGSGDQDSSKARELVEQQGVEYDSVAQAIRVVCRREASPRQVLAVVITILGQAPNSAEDVANRTGYVLTALKKDKPGYTKLLASTDAYAHREAS